jgi:WD40 repeat protein
MIYEHKSQLMGVTAIACGGDGTSSQTTVSSIIVTGGADGSMKQWEMMRQKSNNHGADSRSEGDGPWKLIHWPRLSTQKMKDRAHVFVGGHQGFISAIKCDKGKNLTKIISAGFDGSIRVWDPKSGNEMYRMDGFENVSSICLDNEILVTNGMNEYVCVHDFDAEEQLQDRYDLDW